MINTIITSIHYNLQQRAFSDNFYHNNLNFKLVAFSYL